MIKEEFVSFETAKLLKEAGFDVPCTSQYTEGKCIWNVGYPYNFNQDELGYSRPTQALAARWLREEYDTFVKMERVGSFDGKEFRLYWSFSIISVSTACLKSISGGRYDGYEEALEVGIVQVLERIIEETKE